MYGTSPTNLMLIWVLAASHTVLLAVIQLAATLAYAGGQTDIEKKPEITEKKSEKLVGPELETEKDSEEAGKMNDEENDDFILAQDDEDF